MQHMGATKVITKKHTVTTHLVFSYRNQ